MENIEFTDLEIDVFSDEINVTESVEETPLVGIPFLTDDENTLICQITPAKFDSLLKVLNVLISDKSNNETLIIRNSTITQSTNGSIINSNIKDIFDSETMNLQIINPKKYIRLFKNFKNNNDIFIIDDLENSRFIITNGEIKLFLPKQVETLIEEIKVPNLTNCELICNTKLDKTMRNMINNISSDVDYIEYLIQDDALKGVHIPETAIILFNEFLNDPKAAKLDETNADLTLRSSLAFPIAAEDYDISIGRMEDSSYISVTRCNTGFIKVDIFEPLEVSTGGNILI